MFLSKNILIVNAFICFFCSVRHQDRVFVLLSTPFFGWSLIIVSISRGLRTLIYFTESGNKLQHEIPSTMLLNPHDIANFGGHTAAHTLQTVIPNSSTNTLLIMSNVQPSNAIYFPEGAGYLLVKVLQTRCDSPEIESDVVLVKSLDDNKL